VKSGPIACLQNVGGNPTEETTRNYKQKKQIFAHSFVNLNNKQPREKTDLRKINNGKL